MLSEGLTFGSDLFTTDEVKLVMDKMEQRHWNKPWSLARYFTSLALVRIVDRVSETLDELLTPHRVAEIIERFQSAGQQCLQADDERLRSLVPHIEATICHLQSGEMPSQNKVVSTSFLQQFLTAASSQDAPSPRWRRFFERLEKSRLWRRVSGTADL